MKKIIISLCCGAVLCAGCKKTNTTGNVNSGTAGGKGGSASLLVTPEHHGEFVDSCIIYIKYGTTDAPANGAYDDSAVCVMIDTTPVATFRNLTPGAYYLLAEGFHAAYVPPYVKGGLPHTIAGKTDTDKLFMATYSYNK